MGEVAVDDTSCPVIELLIGDSCGGMWSLIEGSCIDEGDLVFDKL